MFSIIEKFFLWIGLKRLGWEKSIVLIVKRINNLKSLEYHVFVLKHYNFVASAKMWKWNWKIL